MLGDTVRLVDRRPFRLLVTGRTACMLSAFGEHLIEAEIEQSVAAAAATTGLQVVDFAVGPVFSDRSEALGGHLYLVEFVGGAPEAARLESFRDRLDAGLAAANADYRAHRAGDFGLKRPEICALAPGAFALWMKREGRLGGQHKVPRVLSDPDRLARLAAAVAPDVVVRI